MYILGIDTATKVAGASIVKDRQIISERFIHNKLTHSQNLLPMVDQVLNDAGITVRQIDCVAVTGGPGSFTGLRIGMAFAKTIGQVLNIPISSVSTLEALAANVKYFPGLICPILDARREQVYTCLYRWQWGDLPQSMTEPGAMAPDELLSLLHKTDGPIIFLGDGTPIFFDLFKKSLGDRALQADPLQLYSRAAAVALLGSHKIKNGMADDLYQLKPQYLRRSEAEINWEIQRGKNL